MKLHPEPHDKGRDDESKGRRSSFARARSQLTQAVGDVLSGQTKKAGGWLNAFATPTPPTPHADRLREVVIRDRALFAANPRPRRTLREEEEDEAASAAAAQVEDDDLTIIAVSPLAEAAKAAAESAAAEAEAAEAAVVEAVADEAVVEALPVATEPAEAAPVEVEPALEPAAAEDPAVQALAAAIDAAAREERVPEEQEEPAAVAQPAEPDVASAAPAAEPTPLEQLAAKATKVKSKPGAREGRPPKREPIRTRTMARLLASQGHRARALSIYDELIAKDANDATLREEAEALRNQAE